MATANCSDYEDGQAGPDAAFAMLAGAAPIPASSGKTVRYRLNRSGNRQLNRALHNIALSRLRFDPDTRTFADTRRARGKTDRDIKRCLKPARVDGSGELRTFRSIGLPLLVPGLVTIFLLQFIGAWNNFLLPYIMLDSPDLVPITVAMYLMLNRGGSEPVLYSLAIAGSAVAIVPVIAFVLILQRFWRLDLVSGSIT